MIKMILLSAILAACAHRPKPLVGYIPAEERLIQIEELQHEGRWDQALSELNEILNSAGHHPRIKGLSLILLANDYEYRGDPIRKRAALLDSYSLKSALPPEQALAVLPAYLATSYNQSGHYEESKKYLDMANQGVNQLKHLYPDKKDFYAQIFYQMGALPNQNSALSFSEQLKSFQVQQIHLLRSAEENSPNWSARASQYLINYYRHFWQEIQNIAADKMADPLLAQKNRIEQQLYKSESLLLAINQLFLFQSPQKKNNEYVQEIENYSHELKKQMTQFLHQNQSYALKTKESFSRQSTKREGRVYSEPLFPNER